MYNFSKSLKTKKMQKELTKNHKREMKAYVRFSLQAGVTVLLISNLFFLIAAIAWQRIETHNNLDTWYCIYGISSMVALFVTKLACILAVGLCALYFIKNAGNKSEYVDDRMNGLRD